MRTAAVIQLSNYRARQLLPEHDPIMEDARALIVDAMTKVIMEDYAALPLATTTLAIQECSRVMYDGGCFLKAFEAAADVLRRNLPDKPFLWEFGFLKRARMAIVEAEVRRRKPVDLHQALAMARRVIHGGGCIQVAIYHALGEGE